MVLNNISTLSQFMQIHTYEITQLRIFNKLMQIKFFNLFFLSRIKGTERQNKTIINLDVCK